jgi:hypothetical protein
MERVLVTGATGTIARPVHTAERRTALINGRILVGTLSLAALGVAGFVWAYWDRGVTVVLRNRDSATLNGVTIHVTGRDYPVGDIPAGSEKRVLVDPTGESHIEISQQNADGRGRLAVECYFEGGYSGTIEIEISRTVATVVDNRITIGIW